VLHRPTDHFGVIDHLLEGHRQGVLMPLHDHRQAVAHQNTVDSDRQIRSELLDRLKQQDWTDFGSRNVIVSDGVVHLWGLVGSEEEHQALLALAEDVPGVIRVSDEMIPAY
jgi:osmotically-inducible protein OsmY